MSSLPRVAALVPAWNAAAFIEETLGALSAQTYPALEIVVSVDRSPDHTADVVDAYRRVDPRVRLIRQTDRLGFVGNTRFLLGATDAPYTVWAWHDDILLPEYVSTLVPMLEANPRAVCAFTDMELHRLDGRVSTLTYAGLEQVADPVERARRVLWIPENWWLPNRGVVRRAAALRVGGFKRHWAGEYKSDWPWAVHMAILGEHLRAPAVLCRKFIRLTSLSASWPRHRWNNLAATWSCVREIVRSDLPLAAKARLQLTAASVARAFLTQRYEERPEFQRVSAFHRDARAAERHAHRGTDAP